MTKTAVALVTGGSGGIGQGIAFGLADAGWDVAINYRSNRAGAEAACEGIRARGRKTWMFQADIGDSQAVARMFEQLVEQTGGLDVLVNNSGVQTLAPLLELREEDWDRTIRTNLKGTFLCTQQAARLMKDSGGRIINIGSGSNKVPFPNLVDYSASKGGIENLTRVAAVELGRYGITVNCVAPGSIEIERTREEDPEYAAVWSAITPMRRIGYVTDIAAAVTYLASEHASFVSGQTLYVDGGLWSQGPWPYEIN